MHLSELAAKQPDKPAVMMADGSARLTYSRLDEGSCQVSRLLASLGVGPGDHVAVLMANRLEYFAIAWGAQRRGNVLDPGQLAPDRGRGQLHCRGLRREGAVRRAGDRGRGRADRGPAAQPHRIRERDRSAGPAALRGRHRRPARDPAAGRGRGDVLPLLVRHDRQPEGRAEGEYVPAVRYRERARPADAGSRSGSARTPSTCARRRCTTRRPSAGRWAPSGSAARWC